MQKREAAFNTYFLKWVKANFQKTAAFELKQTKTDSIPFSALKLHQEKALFYAKHEHLTWKIPDCGFQNVFDCFSLYRVPAYVVIKYPEKFYLIDIDSWTAERDISMRKSLTEDRAKEICYACG